jgi:hypothetical protein
MWCPLGYPSQINIDAARLSHVLRPRLSDKPSAEDAVRLGCRFQIAAIGLIPPLHR